MGAEVTYNYFCVVKHRVSSDFCAHSVFFSMAQLPLVGHGLFIVEVSRIHSDTPNSVVLLLTSDQLVAQTSTCQHPTLKKSHFRAPGGIRTHNPRKRLAADPRLIPRGHWDRPILYILTMNVGLQRYALLKRKPRTMSSR